MIDYLRIRLISRWDAGRLDLPETEKKVEVIKSSLIIYGSVKTIDESFERGD